MIDTSGRGDPQGYDVVVVGGGHNGLTAAAYLGLAGKRVCVVEAAPTLGGATQSVRAFPGVDANLSRYSYLVSLLPDRIVQELGLRFTSVPRRVSSYTPVERDGRHLGLFVGRGPVDGARTGASFRALTGDDAEHSRWRGFGEDLARFAAAVAPSLLEPLVPPDVLRGRLGDDRIWDALVRTPVLDTVEATFADDLVRGIVLTDALIGTFTDGRDADGLGNRCFWYHVVGNGDGDWKVPVGGMGALVAELARVALGAGVTIRTGVPAVRIAADGCTAEVALADGTTLGARHVLCGAAPRTLARLLGDEPVDEDVEGCQVKVNMVLTRLPRLRSGDDPRDAFAGTLHIDEAGTQLDAAYRAASGGALPDPAPAEVYCHTLTDPSILGPELQAAGWQTLTLFGLHTPASLFDADNEATKDALVRRYLAGLNRYLAEPIEECLAVDVDGRPCIEAKSPLDLDAAVGLPRGNIFHRPLAAPFAEHEEEVGTWGVETRHANVLLCGAGARRGGGVSGIPGRNAAMAVLAAG
jgi:phytoene dehydrogenase-like protein